MLLQQPLRPLLFLETDKDKILPYDERPFHEHTVRGKQGKLLFLGHSRQLFRQAEGAVGVPAGVEETLEGEAAHVVVLPEGWYIGMRSGDIDGGIRNVMIVQPFKGLAAGGTPTVTIDFEHGRFSFLWRR